MGTLSADYAQQVAELLNRLTGDGECSLEVLEELHKIGVWSRGSIQPRGTLNQAAENRLPDPGGVKQLIRCLGDAKSEVRKRAALALGQWAGEEVVSKLQELLRNDPSSVEELYCI